MRLLHVVPSYLPATRYGGTIHSVHALCRSLAARGHAVEVFTTDVDGPGRSDVPLDRAVMRDDVRIRYFASPLLRRIYWSPAMARALSEDMARHDLVHTHSVFLWPTSAAARAARSADIPYIMSPRGMLVPDLIRRRSRIWKSAWIAAFEKTNLARAARIHVTSDLERRDLRQLGLATAPVVEIGNGADDPVAPDALVSDDVRQIVAATPLVLCFGRMSWKKGLERLVAAFAQVRRGTLAIVGTDSEGYAARLRPLVQALGLDDRVRLLPRTVSGADKEALFAAADLFALPSLSENFGNAVLEAMRRGVPVIVTPEVGAAAIVTQSGAGLVTAGTPDMFGAGMADLLSRPDRARAMGEAGKNWVVDRYGWPAIAAQMEALYAEVLATRAPAC